MVVVSRNFAITDIDETFVVDARTNEISLKWRNQPLCQAEEADDGGEKRMKRIHMFVAKKKRFKVRSGLLKSVADRKKKREKERVSN